MRVRSIAEGLIGCALVCGVALGQTPKSQAPMSEQPNPNQHEATADSTNVQRIHQALANDNTLSSSARKVKVTSTRGTVTLRGTVDSEDEKKTVEQKADEIAGADHVTDLMTVKAAKPAKQHK
jgi:osmotically-inducible protein OsmY